MRRIAGAAAVALILGRLSWGDAGAQDRAGSVTALLQNPAVTSALAAAKANEPQTVEDQIHF